MYYGKSCYCIEQALVLKCLDVILKKNNAYWGVPDMYHTLIMMF